MNKNSKFIERTMNLALVGWTLLILGFITTLYWQTRVSAEQLAFNEAKASIRKDVAIRKWVASHGGVYVPVSERTTPNIYLSHIANRDVITDDGQQLTLMNPAYILTQVAKDYVDDYGLKGHITSLNPLNPNNAADRWETKALTGMQKTLNDFGELAKIDNITYMRVLQPMLVTQGCLKCHAHQGYSVGDVRGGISISIPVQPFYDQMLHQLTYTILFLLILWGIGCAAMIHYKNLAKKYWFDKQNDFEQYLYSLVEMIEGRDSYTAGHTRRVADYAVCIAKALKLTDSEIDQLHRAAMVHDIGKIATPDSILLKPGKLNNIEFEIIQQHATSGYQLLYKINTFTDIANIVRSHHEKYDGSGYPDGLSGEEIPKLAQIICIADAFDAMTTDRIYKGRKTVEESLNEIALLAGRQFNPHYAKVAVSALRTVQLEYTTQAQQNITEQQRLAYFYNDQLTGLFNREFLNILLPPSSEKNVKIKPEQIQHATIIYLRHFSMFNQEAGWGNGNHLLVELATDLTHMLPASPLFRVHGDEFIVLSAEQLDIAALKGRLTKHVALNCIEYDVEQFEILNPIFSSIDTLEKHMHGHSSINMNGKARITFNALTNGI